VLFGTGAGIAFFFLRAHRTRDVRIIASVGRDVVLADMVFGCALATGVGYRSGAHSRISAVLAVVVVVDTALRFDRVLLVAGGVAADANARPGGLFSLQWTTTPRAVRDLLSPMVYARLAGLHRRADYFLFDGGETGAVRGVDAVRSLRELAVIDALHHRWARALFRESPRPPLHPDKSGSRDSRFRRPLDIPDCNAQRRRDTA
jgi:Predicted integral membrane protein (DUF2269)